MNRANGEYKTNHTNYMYGLWLYIEVAGVEIFKICVLYEYYV